MRDNKLIYAVLALMFIGILVSGYTLYYTISNKDSISSTIEKRIREELNRLNVPNTDKLDIDEAKIVLAITKYCEANNNCEGQALQGLQGERGEKGDRGETGLQGVQGVAGINGMDGLQGIPGEQGLQGEQGIQGLQGEPGPAGADGREIERRCNPTRNRMEWRLVGDQIWQVEYKLAPGQQCETEQS